MERLSRFLHRRKTNSGRDTSPDLTALSPLPLPSNPQTNDQSHVRQKKSRQSLRQISRSKTVSSPSHRPVRPLRRESQQHSELVQPLTSNSTATAARAAAAAAMYSTRTNINHEEQQLFADFGHMSVKDAQTYASTTYRPSHADRVVTADSPSRTAQSPVTHPIEREYSLSRKPNVKNLKPSQPPPASTAVSSPSPRHASLSPPGDSNKRSSIHKPLPKSPSDEFEEDIASDRAMKHDSGVESELGAKCGYSDAVAPVDLGGVVDLSNTEDTILHETWAPAVTHERITRNVHEVREEIITREIHTHDVYHRVLPVIDFEILPTRHFVPVEGGYLEISEDEVPGGAGDSAQKLIEQAIANLALTSSGAPIVPDRFSARTFEGSEGDYREYTGSDGIKRTEQWWVHPPTLSHERYNGKDTRIELGNPVTLGSGMNTTSPASNVVGVSPLLNEQRRSKVSSARHVRA